MQIIYEHRPRNGKLSDSEWVVEMHRKDSSGKKIIDGLWHDRDNQTVFTREEARKYAMSPEARKQIADLE